VRPCPAGAGQTGSTTTGSERQVAAARQGEDAALDPQRAGGPPVPLPKPIRVVIDLLPPVSRAGDAEVRAPGWWGGRAQNKD
jgi:hypothetical protein